MRTKERVVRVLLFCLGGVLLVCLVASCDGDHTATPEPTVEPEPTAKPTVEPEPTEPPLLVDCSEAETYELVEFKVPYSLEYELSEDELPPYYLEGYVIVTGSEDDIEYVIGQISNDGPVPELTEVNRLKLPELNKQIRLYQYEKGSTDLTIWQILFEIYLAALRCNKQVYASPDYVIANPWDIQESPWSQLSDPLETTSGKLFWDQWAFAGTSHGIGVTYEPAVDVRVVIFDTSPFSGSGLKPLYFEQGPDLCLHVWHPASELLESVSLGYPNHKNHGLFVAGLVHGVVPGTEIHLVKVLNDEGLGDMYTLLKIVEWYFENVPGKAQSVVNLSLGLRPENIDELMAGWDQDGEATLLDVFNPDSGDFGQLIAEVEGGLCANCSLHNGDPCAGNVDQMLQDFIDSLQLNENGGLADGTVIPVAALRFMVEYVESQGAVIVAAAGNEGPSLVQQRPAIWPDVIGVGGSTLTPAPACYSNPGDVYAPGGDGSDQNCQDEAKLCLDIARANLGEPCPYGLLSITIPQDATGGVESDLGIVPEYRYWAGSSFAAPLVSGLAALVQEKSGTPLSSARVWEIIECGAVAMPDPHSDKVIIDIPNTFTEECMPGP